MIQHDDEDDVDERRTFASPPCYAHEVDPAYFGWEQAGQPPAKPAPAAGTNADADADAETDGPAAKPDRS